MKDDSRLAEMEKRQRTGGRANGKMIGERGGRGWRREGRTRMMKKTMCELTVE